MPRKDYHDFIDFFDPLIESFIDAVDDVRHTVEEVYFGRAVTGDINRPNSADERDPNIDVDISVGNFYGPPADDFERDWKAVDLQLEDKEKTIKPPEYGIDL